MNILIVCSLIIWIAIGIFWLFPKKTKLLRKHGFDKTNDFFINLAKNGDLDAKNLLKSTKIFVALGIFGAIFFFFLKKVIL
jgi:hypothetical protein